MGTTIISFDAEMRLRATWSGVFSSETVDYLVNWKGETAGCRRPLYLIVASMCQESKSRGCAEWQITVFGECGAKEIFVNPDPAGLLSMLDTHGAELHALFTRLTMRPAVAEDLLQELFLKLRGANGFERAGNRKAYLFRAAINLAFDWRRAQRPTEPLTTEPAAAPHSPLDHLIDAERMEQVVDAMQHLSELGRKVVVLHYLQQQDYAEIAKQLGKTEHQVRALCSKALGQLQTILHTAADQREKRGARA
jgi:RNA polymerase sigma factor (sigma-70 family)